MRVVKSFEVNPCDAEKSTKAWKQSNILIAFLHLLCWLFFVLNKEKWGICRSTYISRNIEIIKIECHLHLSNVRTVHIFILYIAFAWLFHPIRFLVCFCWNIPAISTTLLFNNSLVVSDFHNLDLMRKDTYV